MEISLKIANAQDETNGASVSSGIEPSTAIIAYQTEPLGSDHVKSVPMSSNDITGDSDSDNAQDGANDCSVSSEIQSSTANAPYETEPLNTDNVESTSITSDAPSYRKFCLRLCVS